MAYQDKKLFSGKIFPYRKKFMNKQKSPQYAMNFHEFKQNNDYCKLSFKLHE